MQLCSKCNKRPAVVFVSSTADPSQTVGYCLSCAKEAGIKPVTDLIDKMGISDEDIEMVQNQMGELMDSGMIPSPEDMEQMAEYDPDENENDDGDFSRGGAPAFPSLFKNLFNTDKNKSKSSESDDKNAKDSSKAPKKRKRKHLDTYCTDLTQKARDGRLDRIIGRDKELDRVIQILSRRTKNNPCLIGEPGVGKTAIAEGLALRIAAGTVPLRLQKKEIHLLDMTALVAGTQFRGQFESRIKGLIDEVKADGNIILFIDEVHSLVGTGDSEGAMNAANIMKPALSRGEIQVIGATTFNEYRKYIEKDAALERRFQPVTVAEPSIAETIQVISGIKSYYEEYHRVRMSDDIVRKTVVLSERYITDRFLPDKAIDLLDESCTHAALRNKELEDYDRNNALLTELKAKEEELTSVTDIDYEKLATIRYDIAKLEKDLDSKKEVLRGAEVTEEDIAHVIELWTGIPASKVQENELNKLADLEEKLKSRVIGQDEAVAALAGAVKRSRVQISPRRRPASFIFVGPTGVGKTELVKVLSTELFNTPETLIRLDMSEYMEKHSVSKIIGSPPGYVGYEEAGQVTEKVRRRPYSVLLFDEIEKAHPDVLNILLQILDEGVLTDAQGRKVNFSNTVIVMTSNAGSEKKENALGFAKTEEEATAEKVKAALGEFLRPEFLSRVDEVIIFRHLTEEDFVAIAALMLGEYVDTLKEKGIGFTFDEKAQRFLAKKAHGGRSGARDLRNLIRKEVEDKIAEAIVESRTGTIAGIAITADDEKIIMNVL
ncbi:MAG: ATP-dependent Clp protease ATP-binding subunit [Clostridia bacterium]|nr:ATP-dependent Clp protease ATP-binding subunit [Clostridia bacterium]